MSRMPPAVTTRPLRQVFLERLIDAGTWMTPGELKDRAGSSQAAIEDALADLVLEGLAEYRRDAGYRLAGGVMARRAAQLLRREQLTRAVCAHPMGGEYRVGVAERPTRESLDLVMYELAMPMPEPGPDSLAKHMEQVAAVLDFSTRGT